MQKVAGKAGAYRFYDAALKVTLPPFNESRNAYFTQPF